MQQFNNAVQGRLPSIIVMKSQKTVNKFKTQVDLEIPDNLRANLLLLTYDPANMTAGEIVEMKERIGKAVYEILEDYPAWLKAYNIRMDKQSSS